MSINSKMTAIADPIRTLKGTSNAMGLDAMASNLGEVVNECDTQAGLIAQIKTVLADKAAGVELPTLTNPGTASDLAEGKQLIDADGNVVDGTYVPLDTSDANVTANKMLAGYSGYANGRKVEGNIQSRGAQTITPSTTAQEIPAGVYLEGKQTIAAIQAETKSVTENGTYTPSNGKYFSSFTVNVPAGSSGSTIKTGTTTSGTINTGLSEIEEFFIYKESQTATGLIHLHYTKDATSRMYASAWSTSNYGTKTITNGTGGVTVSGGTLTISATQAAQGALSSGVTYKWVAIGKE